VGHVIALRRVAVEPFEGRSLVSLDDLRRLELDTAELDALLLPADAALGALQAVRLASDAAYYLCNGHTVSQTSSASEGAVRLYGPNELFLGIGEVLADGQVAPRRLFHNREAGEGGLKKASISG